jgi:hypothetical protein
MARYRNMLVDDQSGITAHAGFTTETWGSPEGYRTRVTCNTTLPTIAGGASLSVGKKAVTLPAGKRLINGSGIDLLLKQSQGNVTADTPDLGLGTTIAAGANALCSDTAGAENILTGQTMNDCDGTVESTQVTTQLTIAAADSHDIFVNVCDGWAASGDAALGLAGTFEFWWR